MYKKLIIIALIATSFSPLKAQPFTEDPNNSYYQYPSQYNGAIGAATASRSGYTNGITTAEIAAGVIAVAIVIVGAVILTNNSHCHSGSDNH